MNLFSSSERWLCCCSYTFQDYGHTRLQIGSFTHELNGCVCLAMFDAVFSSKSRKHCLDCLELCEIVLGIAPIYSALPNFASYQHAISLRRLFYW